MRCTICKVDVDLYDLHKHLEEFHNSDDDDTKDPDYCPVDDEYNCKTESDNSDTPLVKYKCSKKRTADNQPFSAQSHDKPPVKKRKKIKKEKLASKRRLVELLDPEELYNCETEAYYSDTPLDKFKCSKNSPPFSVKKHDKTQVKRRKRRKIETLASKRRLEYHGEIGREKVKLPVLPPLKPWKPRPKEKRPRTCLRAQPENPTKRARFQCRLCPLEVTHLPRHLRDAHGYTKKTAIEYCKGFRHILRKKEAKRKYYKCPVEGCYTVIQWVQQHLRLVHGFTMNQTKHACKVKRHADSDTDTATEDIDVDLQEHGIEYDESPEPGLSAQPDLIPSAEFEPEQPESIPSDTPATNPSENPELITSEKPEPTRKKEPEFIKSWKDHTTMNRFHEYLSSLESGKNEKGAVQHTNQVYKIWSTIDANLQMSTITDGNLIRDKFMEQQREKLTPGTLRSYICSLRIFFNYLRFSDQEGENNISKLMIQTSRWMSVLGKQQALRLTEKQVEDSEKIITPEDISNMKNSVTCKQVENLFEDANLGKNITILDYCRMRNYLILMILLNNGQRSGAIMNLTMRAIRFAKETENGAHVYVTHHKTAHVSPVNLVLNTDLWRLLNIFIHKVRPQLQNITNDELQNNDTCVFLTCSIKDKPRQMTQSVVNRALQSIWVALKQETNVTATLLRKSVVTNVRQVAPEQRENLAMQMTHRASTQDKYYHLTQRQDNAFKVVDLITRVMTQVNKTTTAATTTLATTAEATPTAATTPPTTTTAATTTATITNVTTTATITNVTTAATAPLVTTTATKTNVTTAATAPLVTTTATKTTETTAATTSPATTIAATAHLVTTTATTTETTAATTPLATTTAESSTGEITTEQTSNYIFTATKIGKVALRNDSIYETVSEPHGRRAFDKEDAQFLIETCGFMIDDPPITQIRILDTLNKTVEGRNFIRKYNEKYGKLFSKKAADRIQTERKRRRSSISEKKT